MIVRPRIERGAAALLALAWIACGADEPDADPGAGDDPGDLVGSWRHAAEEGGGETWELAADGGFAYERVAQDGTSTAVEGDYVVDADTIHLVGTYPDQPGTTLYSDMTFHAGVDRASIPAYVPLGDHDGWVGSWTMRYDNRLVYDDGRPEALSGGEELVELRGDGSATWRITSRGQTEPQVLTGTWREAEGAIELMTVLDGVAFPWSFPTLDGEALAQFPLERQE